MFKAEILEIIFTLLPGFLAAWCFYGLTAHRKTIPFERVIEALIFSAIIQFATLIVRECCLLSGKFVPLGTWTEDGAFVVSILLGLVIGLLFASCANNDTIHRFLRENDWLKKYRITSRTSFPSEWFSTLATDQRYIVLHMAGGRRLYGWPYEWPDHSDTGHFVMTEPEWLLDDGERVPVFATKKVVIPAAQVEMIEVVDHTDAEESEIEETTRRLIAVNRQAPSESGVEE